MKPSHGFLVVDKPGGITSRRAVNFVQRWFPRGTKMGHAGTLDPLATGVLVVAVGRAARVIEYVQRMEKEYHAAITLGAVSDTDDADGLIAPCAGAATPAREEIDGALQAFMGEIEQVPPAYSAARVEGRRAHQLARRGREIELAPRKILIHEIRVLSYDYPTLKVMVRCGKGTYIRSLARDLGQRLGCGGYIESLRRTRVGSFDLPALQPRQAYPDGPPTLLPLELALGELTRVPLTGPALEAVGHGRRLDFLPRPSGGESELAIEDPDRRVRAIVSWIPAEEVWKPTRVFRADAD